VSDRKQNVGEKGLPSGRSATGHKTASGAVSRSRPASCQAFRAGVALFCPKRAQIADAIGIKYDTFNQFLNGRVKTPPAVTRVLADLLREQSKNLLIAASGLEAA